MVDQMDKQFRNRKTHAEKTDLIYGFPGGAKTLILAVFTEGSPAIVFADFF